jgi:hypothetical protein
LIYECNSYGEAKGSEVKTGRQLVEEAEKLLDTAGKIQDETQSIQVRETKLKELENLYHTWYRYALSLFDNHKQLGERQMFEQEYSGSFLFAKILKFLTSGLEVNPFYVPDNPLTAKYTYPFVRCFKEPLLKQCNLLSKLETLASTSLVTGEESAWNVTICRIFTVFLEKAENAKTNHEKKLTYEYLAIFLLGAIDGLTMIGHDERGASEEIDLWIANEAKDAFWQRVGSAFIVECKNWGAPVGVPEIRNLKSIMEDKNIAFAILLSRNGVTGDRWHDAIDIIRNAFREEKYIIVLDQAWCLD